MYLESNAPTEFHVGYFLFWSIAGMVAFTVTCWLGVKLPDWLKALWRHSRRWRCVRRGTRWLRWKLVGQMPWERRFLDLRTYGQAKWCDLDPVHRAERVRMLAAQRDEWKQRHKKTA